MNMAVDEALALAAPASGFCPILRIYRWSRPSVSIGCNQKIARGVDLGFCCAHGIEIVRRPTGGRAVYHHQELTYAVIVPRSFLKTDTILASYRVLARGFMECLGLLGISGELIAPELSRENRKQRKQSNSGKKRGNSEESACFLIPSGYEIGVGGKKIIGSAQRRYRLSILQHGSFLLDIDWERFLRVFSKSEGKKGNESITCLGEVSGRKIGYEEVVPVLTRGFEKAFGVRMIESDLTEQEHDLAKRLVQEKYSSTDWNINRIDRFLNPQAGVSEISNSGIKIPEPPYNPDRKFGESNLAG